METLFRALLHVFAWPAGILVNLAAALLVFSLLWVSDLWENDPDCEVNRRIARCYIAAGSLLTVIASYKTASLWSVPAGATLGLALGIVWLFERETWPRAAKQWCYFAGTGMFLIGAMTVTLAPDLFWARSQTAPNEIIVTLVWTGALIGCISVFVRFLSALNTWVKNG